MIISMVVGWSGLGMSVALAESSQLTAFTETVPAITVPDLDGVEPQYRIADREDGKALVTVYLDRVPNGYSVRDYWQANHAKIAQFLTVTRYGQEGPANPREVYWEVIANLETNRNAVMDQNDFYRTMRADMPWELPIGIFTPRSEAVVAVAQTETPAVASPAVETIPTVTVPKLEGSPEPVFRSVEVGEGVNLVTVQMMVPAGYSVWHYWRDNRDVIGEYFTADRAGFASIDDGRNVYLETVARIDTNREAATNLDDLYRTMRADRLWELPIAYLRTVTETTALAPVGMAGQESDPITGVTEEVPAVDQEAVTPTTSDSVLMSPLEATGSADETLVLVSEPSVIRELVAPTGEPTSESVPVAVLPGLVSDRFKFEEVDGESVVNFTLAGRSFSMSRDAFFTTALVVGGLVLVALAILLVVAVMWIYGRFRSDPVKAALQKARSVRPPDGQPLYTKPALSAVPGI
jgi:hypothetical protein